MRKLSSVLSSTLQGGVRRGLLFFALLATTTLWAHDFSVNGIYYNFLDDNNVAVTYKGSDYYEYSNEYSGEVIIPETVTYNGTTYSVTNIGDYAFFECTPLTSVTIGNSVTSIGNEAFRYSPSLTSPVYNAHCFAYMPPSFEGAYTIPDGIKQIAGGAFCDCTSLTSVTIGNSVTSIGNAAFRYCPSLTSVTIGNSVTSIGDDAFTSCYSLTSITCEATIPPTIESIAFNGVYKSIRVYVPCGSESAYKAADFWRDFTNIQEPQAEYSIQVYTSNSQMGSAKVNYNNCIGTQITATANYGYHFAQWLDGNTDNPRSIVLTQDTSFVAHFAPNNYAISTQSSDAERGTTSGNVTTTYLDYVTISATANYGYHFTQWNDGNTDNPRKVQVTEDKTYTAYFDKNTYHITKNYDSNQGYVDGYSSGEYLDNIILTADPNYGYHLVQWSDGVTDNPRSFVLTQDTTFVAVFAPNNYTISTLSSDIERGTTSGDITTTYLDYVTISATANYGYHFSHWNDYNYDNPRQVQVTEDKTYTAYFDKNTYYITKNYDSNQGYVNGYSSGEYLDNITLTAEPNPGYHFTQWADGNTDNPRTIILTQDTIMMAEFAQSYSGQCGDNLYWAYDNTTQKLSISGMGDMYDYTATTQPWVLFKEEIMAVDIINTATSIGASAFEGCKRLGSVNIGVNIEDIGANAFAGCTRLYDIYCYPIYPPFVEASSFANYNVYLYVPCLNIREYEMDIVWGNFKYIQCMGAEDEEIEDGTVEVTTSTNSVTITWPTEENANTYIIEIKKDGVVFCRLTFNADGQLLNISFAPGRDGNHPAQFATKTTNGLRFTVTGLEESTNYTYDIISKDENNESIETYSGEFKTQSNTPTDVGNLDASTSNVHKLLRNGHLIIVRDGVEHTIMGQEM